MITSMNVFVSEYEKCVCLTLLKNKEYLLNIGK
jgi:hypothetical protein